MPVRVVAAVLAVVLLAAGDAAADYRNPVLPGDYPDPSVVRVGDDFWATATSDRWAPLFPVLHSRDLVSWRQVGSVLPTAPRWARGGRFWAPEISFSGGRLVVLYAGLRRPGQFCIGVATAVRGEGPWTDHGPLTCRPGGAIDPVAVRREDGTDWLVWKAKGVGGGLFAQQVDLAALEVTGSPVALLAPGAGERGVTEGPTIVKRGRWWYLVHATGNCCGPPCTYVTAVARSESLLGPYVKARRPILQGGDVLRCPGHGTLVDLADGRLFFLHHAYEAADLANRRRQGVLTPVGVGEDEWLSMGAAGTPVLDDQAPLGGAQEPAPSAFADDFRGPGLGIGWQWLIRRRVPEALVAGDGRLELGCGRFALVARQVATDGFRAEVTVRPGGGSVPALVVRERSGVLRGVEVRDGRVRALRREGVGVRTARGVAVPRRAAVRLVLTLGPDGLLTAAAGRRGLELDVPAGPAAFGQGPTRVGLACRGTGTARFSAFRLGSTDGRAVGVESASAG